MLPILVYLFICARMMIAGLLFSCHFYTWRNQQHDRSPRAVAISESDRRSMLMRGARVEYARIRHANHGHWSRILDATFLRARRSLEAEPFTQVVSAAQLVCCALVPHEIDT